MASRELSSDEGDAIRPRASKKRKVHRACDVCRRKKIRCTGSVIGDTRCSNCIEYKEDCTYNKEAERRYHPKAYVEGLENRVKQLEALITQIRPDIDLTGDLNDALHTINPANSTQRAASGILPSAGASGHVPSMISSPSHDPEDGYVSSDDGEMKGLYTSLEQLNLNPTIPRFFGRFSATKLLQTAFELRHQLTGAEPPHLMAVVKDLQSQRPDLWTVPSWEREEMHREAPGVSSYVFPEPDLLPTLVDLYFTEVNTLYPVLHRSLFERSLFDGLHMRDDRFANLLLVVCSIGARYADDNRIYMDGQMGFSAGWKWYNQIQFIHRTFISMRLQDLQLYALAAIFSLGSSSPQASWSLVGIGIRCAQDLGAHRRKMYKTTPTLENELWKRVFWVLVVLDRIFSIILARPCIIQDEDLDADLPLLVDDDFWDRPDESRKPSQQPDDGPSTMGAFLCLIKLSRIIAFALRTIYSISKSKMVHGFMGPEWEQRVVAESDSALNKWHESIPDYLRWSQCSDPIFFHQSAALHVLYYYVQIAIHRPFILDSTVKGGIAPSSMAICTSAARSISRILQSHAARRNRPLPLCMNACMLAGAILYVNIWHGLHRGSITDPCNAVSDIHRCISYYKPWITRWHSAGRGSQGIKILLQIGGFPLPTTESSGHDSNQHGEQAPVENQNMTRHRFSGETYDRAVTQLHAEHPVDEQAPLKWRDARREEHALQDPGSDLAQSYPELFHRSSLTARYPIEGISVPAALAPSYTEQHPDQSHQPGYPDTIPQPSSGYTPTNWMQDPVNVFGNMIGEFYGLDLPHDLDVQTFDDAIPLSGSFPNTQLAQDLVTSWPPDWSWNPS